MERACRRAGKIGDVILNVLDTLGMAGPVSRNRCRKRRDQSTHIACARWSGPRAQIQHRQSGCRTLHRKPAAIPAISRIRTSAWLSPEKLGKGARDTAAELHCCPLAPRRTADQMRQYGRDQDEWRHAQRHATAGLVDLIDDQIIAPPPPLGPSAGRPTPSGSLRPASKRSARDNRNVQPSPGRGSTETGRRASRPRRPSVTPGSSI